MRSLSPFHVVVLAILLAARHASAQLIISEFMAANNGGLLDQDGDASDWIELQNTGATTLNLAGWRLTDDPADPGKWTLPATNLAPGRFLVVFASGKNRAVPGGELHANFQLDSNGEYLALIRPDGVTVEAAFAPAYPTQQPNISYGAARVVTTTTLIGDARTARWRVPLSAADRPADWATSTFDDSLWTAGPLPVGFDAGQIAGGAGGATTNLARGRTTTQSSTLGGFTANLAVNNNPGDFTHTAAGQNLPATWEVNLGTNASIERIVIYNRADCCGSRLRDITVFILSPDGAGTNFVSALLNPENILGAGLTGPASLTVNLTNLTGGRIQGGRVRITRTPDPDLSGSGGQGNSDEGSVLSLGEVEVWGSTAPPTFDSIVRTDIEAAMRNVNASALIRIPFLVVAEDLPVLAALTLRMKYDDGFTAYLNGVPVASANAPAGPAWNAAATAEQPDPAAMQFADFDLTSQTGLLQNGINVLAIQAHNLNAADDDLLVQPELTGRSVAVVTEQYFTQPTAGATNTAGTLGLVADTRFSVDRGFFDVPFTVAITTATAGAEIRYTTNGSAPSAVNGILYTGPITISRTTVLRAIATRPGFTPSNVDTHTYVFLDDVLAQSQASVTGAGYPASWAGVAADYAMDPRITSSTNAATMRAAMRSLPSVFFSTSISNLFDNNNGIYAQPTTHGVAWERPVSMEMIDTNGVTEFQENCGLRIQGGYFRDPNVTQKHSLRVLFKAAYGTGKLRHDVFKSSDAVQEFDTLVLRAGANDGYAWGDAKDTEQFIRDEFGRGLHRSMGHPASHGRLIHVYLNGVYWGMYNLVERANEDFSASYFGGDAVDWDSNNAGDVKNGDLQAWNTFNSLNVAATTVAAYQQVQGNNPDGTRNPAYPVYLDKLNYIDYMIANIWGGNWDWPNKNFWFGRLRTTNSTGFKFYMWDFENTMGNNRGRSPLDMVSPRAGIESSWVGQPHAFLKNLAEYRMDFADRVQRHFFNGGTLTPGVLTNRYRQLAASVEPAILAETARWGDDNLNPPQDIEDWRRERDWLLGTYLPQRSAIVLQQFRAAGLYPTLGAPVFNQFGGVVPDGFLLTLSHTNTAGAIRFTTDGTDPRLLGGAVNASAQTYSQPLAITAPVTVRARVLNGTTWSALVEATLYPPQDLHQLQVSEIMYHPAAEYPFNGDDYEFLELKNTGPRALNLSGAGLTGGVNFRFTDGTFLGAGQFLVLVRNRAAFATRHPGVTIGGVYDGSLDNAGETIELSDAFGVVVQSFRYNDKAPWPVVADGLGFSLVPVDPAGIPDPSDPAHWRASTGTGGSPGTDDPAPPARPGILINEALSASAPPAVDRIELFNPTATVVNIGGWFLTDSPDTPAKFRIPDGTLIPAGGFLVFSEADFNPVPGAPASFSLQGEGDDVYLFSADAAGRLTGHGHGFSFGAAAPGVSFGRHVNSVGLEEFVAQRANSFGSANAGPLIGPVVLSEVLYHPVTEGTNSGAELEFVELENITGQTVPLFDPAFPANPWRLRGGIDFNLPGGLTLAPGARLVVVGFDPANAAELAAFRAAYQVPAGVPVVGPWNGRLDNAADRIELQRPDAPIPGNVPYVLVDAVSYGDTAPWPVSADGLGPSLQRRAPAAYGNDPVSWFAAGITAGQAATENVSPTLTLLTPTAGAVYLQPTNVLFTSATSDPDGRVTRVEYFADGVFVGDSTNPPAFAFAWSNAAFGSRVLTARARDNGLAFAHSPAVPVTIVSQPPVVTLLSPTNGAIFRAGNSINLAATASDPDGSIRRLDFQANGVVVASLTTPPYVSTWTNVPAGSHRLAAVAVDDSGTVRTSAVTQVSVAAFLNSNVQLVASNAVWRYLDDASDQGTAWRQTGFNDAGWSNGIAQLGWGDNDEGTRVRPTNQLGTRVITYYFRRQFTVDSFEGVTNLLLRVLRDDGAIAYLNGVEVYRSNLTNGPVGHRTLALVAVSGTEEATLYPTNLSPTRLNPGINTLAVEVHVARTNDTDMSFAADLAFNRSVLGPVILQGPAHRTNVLGTTAQFTATVTGDAPLTYRWHFNGVPIAATNAILTLTNVQFAQAGTYQVVVGNLAGSVTSAPAGLTVVSADTDGDGLPDDWELANGTNPGIPDGDVDADGDGLTNRQEYLAGTDPRDPASVLRISAVTLVQGGTAVVLQFPAAAGRTYSVLSAVQPTGTPWQRLADVPAAPVPRLVTLTNPVPGADRRYYRLVTPQQP